MKKEVKKNFKVLAVNKNGEEIQKWFGTEKEAEAYARKCLNKGCFCISIVDGRNW